MVVFLSLDPLLYVGTVFIFAALYLARKLKRPKRSAASTVEVDWKDVYYHAYHAARGGEYAEVLDYMSHRISEIQNADEKLVDRIESMRKRKQKLKTKIITKLMSEYREALGEAAT